ncbi:formamidopyrimidine-DNA glycosylase [Arthrobacter pascens]|uniref:Fpg/Nei family DNA glycosylase n=1 Tax=Arthrobacter pascens TaxID=1677 RepID=UPI002864245C|nr:DNA-formamidopyrimidine glycosylase family protein [Arthrobacter pascens]MDR6559138.1 formamidopyrimidine-DNA glycosylase [Arthrobacter pascens]
MPELPEVAGLSSFLGTHLEGTVLTKLQVLSVAVLKTASPPFTALEGRAVTGVRRFGKFVSIDADGLHFVFHLARAGWVRYTEAPAAPAGQAASGQAPAGQGTLRPGKGPIAARLAFAGKDGLHIGIDLTEAGTKKSLAVYVVEDPQDVPGIAALGPDPLDPGFSPAMFAGILAASHHQVKGVLRSQSVIAGIGNAYSDEILHAARISPYAMADSLDEETVRVLYDAIHSVLGAAVKEATGKAPGDLKDTKRGGMRVHGRAGLPCPVCGDTVREVSFADTSLQYCPTCQTNGKILADRRTSRFLK